MLGMHGADGGRATVLLPLVLLGRDHLDASHRQPEVRNRPCTPTPLELLNPKPHPTRPAAASRTRKHNAF